TCPLFQKPEGPLERRAPREAWSGPDRRQEVHGRRRADDPFVSLRPRFEMLGRLRVGRLDAGRIKRLEAVEAAPENADVRTVELVRGAGEKVAVEPAHRGQERRGGRRGGT